MNSDGTTATTSGVTVLSRTQCVDEADITDRKVQSSQVIPAADSSVNWQKTLKKVASTVVGIRISRPYSFDTETACTSEATGAVVDVNFGLILTNAHVIGPGPFTGFATFDTDDECPVYAIYRDPVHDFGFLRFDPKELKHPVQEVLELRPDLAKVGLEIRIIGNDAGQKLSFVSGVISRTDRNVPPYSRGYSDFNSHYFQTATSSGPGSSGSPVVDCDGHAVALQAGGIQNAATDFLLPLDRALRALKCIQDGMTISRGTIQTQWMMKTLNECRRLGLASEWEAEIREQFPTVKNLLVAEIVLSGGQADKKIREGDVLIKVNDELLTEFVRLDDILDSSVNFRIKLLVQRSGRDVEVELDVGDLHQITPDRLVTVAGINFHNISYQRRRRYNITVQGVFARGTEDLFGVVDPNLFPGIEEGRIVESINYEETPDLTAVIEVMRKIPDRSRVTVGYRELHDLHTLRSDIVYIDRHWKDNMSMVVRNNSTGLWDYQHLTDAPPPSEPEKVTVTFQQSATPHAVNILRNFVRVESRMPVNLEGFWKTSAAGYGLILDNAEGLVLVSRVVLPHDLCDIFITIGNSVTVEARIEYLHPWANYAVIRYNSSQVDAEIVSVELSKACVKPGASRTFLGYDTMSREVRAKTMVTHITTMTLQANSDRPRYRVTNFDAVAVDEASSLNWAFGILVDEEGIVEAIWLTFLGRPLTPTMDSEQRFGISTPSIGAVIDKIKKGLTPDVRSLGLEMRPLKMHEARTRGVSEAYIQKVAQISPSRHQLVMVYKVDCTPALDVTPSTLKEGDILLTLNGELITAPDDLDSMCNQPVLRALIIRKGREMQIDVPTFSTANSCTNHVLSFCGAIFHAPHHAVRQQRTPMHSYVYLSSYVSGCPAEMHDLDTTSFVTAVNHEAVQTMADFQAVVAKIPDKTYFRLDMVGSDNRRRFTIMQNNEGYFPTVEYLRNGIGDWKMRTLSTKRES